MTEVEVVTLMESATSERDWNNKCDEIKRRCGGYPPCWYKAIISSGLARRVMDLFGASPDITIHTR
jgi:hypothetical protein